MLLSSHIGATRVPEVEELPRVGRPPPFAEITGNKPAHVLGERDPELGRACSRTPMLVRREGHLDPSHHDGYIIAADEEMAAGWIRDSKDVTITTSTRASPAPPDVEIVVKRPAARALALAQLGRLDDARVFATEAVSNAEGRGYLNYEAEALLVQAEVLRLSGDLVAARGALEDAVGVLDRKGNTVLAAKARATLEALAA